MLRWFCGRAQELEVNVSSHWSKWWTPNHLFHKSTGKVEYALGNLGSWAYHTHLDIQMMIMIDSTHWGQHLQMYNWPSLHNFNLLDAEIQKMYHDKDWRLNMARKWCYSCLQGYWNANENLWEYANWRWHNWRELEWDGVLFQLILHGMVCMNTRADLLLKLWPFIKANWKFNTIDKPFAPAADVEPEPQKCDNQQQKPQGESSCSGNRICHIETLLCQVKEVLKHRSKPNTSDMSSGSGCRKAQSVTMGTKGGLCIMERHREIPIVQWQRSWNLPIRAMLQAEVLR